MKDQRSIEEQVAELTEQQKDTIVKVGKWGTIILLVAVLPPLALFFLGAYVMVTNPLIMTDAAFIGWELFGSAVFAFVIAYIVIIKVKFPYYSDKKARYIMKERKNK